MMYFKHSRVLNSKDGIAGDEERRERSNVSWVSAEESRGAEYRDRKVISLFIQMRSCQYDSNNRQPRKRLDPMYQVLYIYTVRDSPHPEEPSRGGVPM